VERWSERSAQPAAAASRDFFAFWLTTKQQHNDLSSIISYSMLNDKWNGDVYERH